jgi:Tol biopolymer transport system component
VSPDGNLLAYRDEQSQLALFDFTSNRKRSLGVDIPAEQWRLVLTWSQDGSRLAYNRHARDGLVQIQIIALDGRAPKVVTEHPTYVAPLLWSADGDQLLIAVEQGNNDEVSWVPVGAGAATVVKRLDGSRRSGWRPIAVLSPDGQFLVLSKIADGGENRDLIVMRLDGTQEQNWGLRSLGNPDGGRDSARHCAPHPSRRRPDGAFRSHHERIPLLCRQSLHV